MDIQQIRAINLREWFKDKSLPQSEKSYISQLINGKASFGEKAARRLEKTYGMPHKHLDARAPEEESIAKVMQEASMSTASKIAEDMDKKESACADSADSSHVIELMEILSRVNGDGAKAILVFGRLAEKQFPKKS